MYQLFNSGIYDVLVTHKVITVSIKNLKKQNIIIRIVLYLWCVAVFTHITTISLLLFLLSRYPYNRVLNYYHARNNIIICTKLLLLYYVMLNYPHIIMFTFAVNMQNARARLNYKSVVTILLMYFIFYVSCLILSCFIMA